MRLIFESYFNRGKLYLFLNKKLKKNQLSNKLFTESFDLKKLF